MEWILYLVSGLAAGFFAGLLGVGGGTIVVPVLYFLFKYYQHLPHSLIMHMAIGTSLAVVFINAVLSMHAHARKKNVLWPIFNKMILGLILGATIASLVVNYISGNALHILFIIFIVFSACQVIWKYQPKKPPSNLSLVTTNIAGMIISFFSSLVGIGGSILSVPYFLWLKIEMKQAVALASCCGLPLSIVATAGFMIAGLNHANLPNFSLGYVYLPALLGIGIGAIFTASLGAKVAIKLPEKFLRTVFFGFLVCVAISMAVDF